MIFENHKIYSCSGVVKGLSGRDHWRQWSLSHERRKLELCRVPVKILKNN